MESIKEFNKEFANEIARIRDSYFRDKLENGLVPYEPQLWSEAQLNSMEENTLR